MKRWQRIVVAHAVVAALTCVLIALVIVALVFTFDETGDERWLGMGALAIVFLGATQILAIRDRIIGSGGK